MSKRTRKKKKVESEESDEESSISEQSEEEEVKPKKTEKSKKDDTPVPGADELEKLLTIDPTTLTSREDFCGAFDNISKTLMNNFTMVINSLPHRIAEVEYYFCGDKHMDVFTHQDALQESSGKWYFHRTGKGYKGGSYKGLDITFGQKGFGGILIRAILSIDNNEYIEGPCNVVNHILAQNKTSKTIPEIIEFVEQDDFDLSVTKKGNLYLQKDDSLEQLGVVAGPRVGLTLKKTDGERSYFLMKNYRFMSHPLKVRKGRVNLVLGLYAAGKNAKEIQTITGCAAATIKKYVELFDLGKKNKKK